MNLTNENELLELAPEEAYQLIGRDTIFIDLREEFEFADKSMDVYNVYNFPFASFVIDYHKIPKDKKIILVCLTGIHSVKAFDFLKKQRYKNVFILNGGIIHWATEGLPMKSNPDSLPEDIFNPHQCKSHKNIPDILE